MKTDDICARYSGKSAGLTLRLLEDEDGDPPTTVLIEGPARALKLLAELLMAVADEVEDEGFSISPVGAGKEHFLPGSPMGVYIHRKSERKG